MPLPDPGLIGYSTVARTGVPVSESTLPIDHVRRIHDRGTTVIETVAKYAKDVLDYRIDLAEVLHDEPIIGASAWCVPEGSVHVDDTFVTTVTFTPGTVVLWLANGVEKAAYRVHLRVFTEAGHQKLVIFRVKIAGKLAEPEEGDPNYEPTIASREYVNRGVYKTGDKQKWVLMADGQPKTPAQRAIVQNVILHIHNNHPDAHAVIYAGDIVHRGNNPGEWNGTGWPGSEAWWPASGPLLHDTAKQDLRMLPTAAIRLLTLLGNHDWNYGSAYSPSDNSPAAYRRWFGKLFYHVIIGNICLVFMSPMARATAGNVPDFVLDWWRNLTFSRMFGSCLTITHQPIQNTTAGSETSGGSLVESDRFIDLLEEGECRTDLWFSGHTGSDLNNPEVVSHGEFFNSNFVALDMNSGIDDEGQPTNAGLGRSYVVMEFEHGSPTINLKRINVDTGEVSKEWEVEASNPLELAAHPSFDGRFQIDDQFHVNNFFSVQAVEVPRQSSDGGVTYEGPNRVVWVKRTILTDFGNNNVQQGCGPGELWSVPGSALNGGAFTVAPELNRPYGVGGGWAFVKGRMTDDDYRTHAQLYTSTEGAGEDSLVKCIEVEPDLIRLEKMTILSGTGAFTVPIPMSGLTPHFQLSGTGASSSGFGLSRWNALSAGAAYIVMGKSRSDNPYVARPSVPSMVLSGDSLGECIFAGDDGTGIIQGSVFRVVVDAVTVTGKVRARFEWQTHNGTANAARMKLHSDGGLTISTSGGADPTGASKGGGTINVAGGYYVNTNQVVGARSTGWTAMSGAASNKGALAAAAAGTASAGYVQAELQGALNRIEALEARLRAYDDALFAHGLIGA